MNSKNHGMIKISAESINTLITQAFVRQGVSEDVAGLCSEGMVQTSLRGVDTHGIRLLSHYIEAIEGGRINKTPKFQFKETSLSTGILDADHSLGYGAGIIAMRHAIELAKKSGSGFVSVKNSSHCGTLAYYGLEACKHDMIGLAFTHATSRMKSPGSNREFFGTNPLCFTAPMESEEPFCFDSAPTPIPFHKVKHNRETNSPLPTGSAADKYGNVTTDPHKAAQLLPIGDYKGFGLAMMVDILCGLLSGMSVGRDISKMYDDSLTEKRFLGQFFGALRIDAFESPEIFKNRLQQLAEAIRNEPKLDESSENMVPGDPEKKMMKERIAEGIPVDKLELERLNMIAGRFGVPPVEIIK